MSGIEWGVFPNESAMNMFVHDNTTSPPTTVLKATAPFFVHVSWEVPAALAAIIGGSFRVRAYAESIGPGQEKQIGLTHIEPAVPGVTAYTIHIAVPAGPDRLLGEGEAFGGVPVSGLYKMAAVLQHLNPGANECSGYAENEMIFLRTP